MRRHARQHRPRALSRPRAGGLTCAAAQWAAVARARGRTAPPMQLRALWSRIEVISGRGADVVALLFLHGCLCVRVLHKLVLTVFGMTQVKCPRVLMWPEREVRFTCNFHDWKLIKILQFYYYLLFIL